MDKLSIKEKIIATDMLILSQSYLKKILEKSEKKYGIDTLVQYGYIAVIKKWESYYNLLLKSFKNPYVLWSAYMASSEYMFGGFDRYNKDGFITQVSNIFTIYNLKYSRNVEILGIRFQFKKVKKEVFYGIKTENFWDFSFHYMNRERLFIEFVRDYQNYDDLFFKKIISTLDIPRLQEYLISYPIQKVAYKIKSLLCI